MGCLCERLGTEHNPELESALERLVANARDAQPDFASDMLVDHLAALPSPPTAADQLSGLHGGDLACAAACAQGNAAAQAYLDQRLAEGARRSLARMNGLDQLDEVMQQVRVRLLVSPMQIRSYAGKGPLVNWLGVVATRTFLNIKRKREPDAPSGEDSLYSKIPNPDLDPELAGMRDQYQDAFRKAFHAALGELPPREKNLLRHHYIDGLNLDALARRFQTSRATAHRWLVSARVQLAEQAESLLRSELAVDGDELRSLRRVLHSDLDLSLVRVLAA